MTAPQPPQGPADPTHLAYELASIDEALFELRHRVDVLGWQYLRLDADTLTTNDPTADTHDALQAARDTLDHLSRALRTATHVANGAHAHLARLHSRNQH